MYNEQLEKLIEMALMDGELTEKEKQILFKKAESFGVDLDEFEMVLDAKLAEKLQSQQKTAEKAAAAPKSGKYGDVRKCPSCGAILQSFQTKCDECGYEFKNVESVNSASKLFDLLQAVELRKSKSISEHNQTKSRRLDELSKRHNNDSGFVKVLGGKTRSKNQDEEREDLIRELNEDLKTIEKKASSEKATIIKNFPVPNAKEDLLELLAMASSSAYDNDGVIGKEEEVWIQKTDQIYQKIIICAASDKSILEQSTNMIVSLRKRLPKEYKNFTQIPQSVRSKVEAEMQAEKDTKKAKKTEIMKKYGIPLAVSILLLFLSPVFGMTVGGLLVFVAIGGIIVSSVLWCKALKDMKNDF
ncbi:MAG: hypothetical protein PHV24_00920 [Candidatus Kapabacteria bacterium]|nr:hypothetical protein [Candidatus Kapabacteria bacterium]